MSKLIITKIELIEEQPYYYRVTYNEIWRLINNFNQIKESSNWDEVKSILLPIERKRKLNKLMDNEIKIYNKVIYTKTDY